MVSGVFASVAERENICNVLVSPILENPALAELISAELKGRAPGDQLE